MSDEKDIFSQIHEYHVLIDDLKNENITFIDDYSTYTVVYLVRSKDEAFEMFLKYKSEVKNQLNKKIKILRSDKGGEYELKQFNEFCE